MTKPTDAPLEWFANKMLEKRSTSKNKRKRQWPRLPYYHLIGCLKNETAELIVETKKLESGDGDADAVISECCDIANYALFIADNARCGRLNFL